MSIFNIDFYWFDRLCICPFRIFSSSQMCYVETARLSEQGYCKEKSFYTNCRLQMDLENAIPCEDDVGQGSNSLSSLVFPDM